MPNRKKSEKEIPGRMIVQLLSRDTNHQNKHTIKTIKMKVSYEGKHIKVTDDFSIKTWEEPGAIHFKLQKTMKS